MPGTAGAGSASHPRFLLPAAHPQGNDAPVFENLREAVRAEATERTWSQGVQLARDQRVTGRSRSGDELVLEVRVPGRPTPFEVILNPAHSEWECDCTSKEAACSHVVAAVIAAEQTGGDLPRPASAGAPIRYLLAPAPGV